MTKSIKTAIKSAALITAAAAALSGVPAAYAANGDIAGTIYNTDILTIIDGVPIQSYSIDGTTVIPLEELENYGYVVYYNDDMRTVFVTRASYVPQDLSPQVKRGTVGGVSGNIYESDIVAYLNGKEVTAYAMDGKMAVVVEDIGFVTTSSSTELGKYYQKYNISPYGYSYKYFDSSRLLSLSTRLNQFPSKSDMENDMALINERTYNNRDWTQTDKYELDGYDIIIGEQEMEKGKTMQTIEYFGDDGLYLNLGDLLANNFHFYASSGYGPSLTILSVKDGFIRFSSSDHWGYGENSTTRESGTYELELPRLALTKID